MLLQLVALLVAVDATKLADADRLLHEAGDDDASYNGAVAAYDAAIAAGDAPSSTYGHEAEAFLRLGDLAKGEDAKLALYKKAQAKAEEGAAKDPRCASCWFWRGASLGRWGQTRGIMQSLFVLGDVKESFQKVLALDPDNVDALLSTALIDAKLPGIAGGSVERAETAMRKVVARAPTFTRARLDLAEVLWDAGKKDEARTLAQGVLDEQAPLHAGEYRKFDVRRAQSLLASWR